MTIPPQPTPHPTPQNLPHFLSGSHHFPFPSQFPLKIHTMHNPRTQFSHRNDHSHHTNEESDETSTISPNDEDTLQFRPIPQNQESLDGEDSGVCSPPLWKSPAASTPSASPSLPLLSHHIHRSLLSPNSRTQAIARGQRELMEMVKNMPESSYELSLKDLVEHHTVENNQTHEENLSKNQVLHQRVVVKRQGSWRNDRNLIRHGNFENKGLLLNMGFQFNSRKKKKFGNNGTNSGRISPKPEVVKGGGERDWWKKKFTGSSDSDSSRRSGGSSTTVSSGGGRSSSGRSDAGDREKNGLLSGCWPFFQSRKSKFK